MNEKIILIILDGWGIAPTGPGNCLSQAKIPFFNSAWDKHPHCQLEASGNAVGLPKGVMGTSEVGHLHMGAGRIVWQPEALIDNEIESKKFFKNPPLLSAMRLVKKKKKSLHLMGLCSDGKVHSSLEHLLSLLDLAKQQHVEQVFVHFIADGRDTPERSAITYIRQIEQKMKKNKLGKIASIAGRYYSMDRDSNYNRTQKAYEMLVEGKGFTAKSATEAVQKAYDRNDPTDYYIQPTAILEKNKPVRLISENDTVIFFNTRTDRIRQIIKSFVFEDKDFPYFKRAVRPKVSFLSFVQTDATIPESKCIPVFNPTSVNHNLAKLIAEKKIPQLRIAETEKYAHVTYFFNAQVEEPYPLEDRILVPSLKVPSYDQQPEMSAKEITQKAVDSIKTEKYGFILVNFANTDLVGHSANIQAIILAAECVDNGLSKICPIALEKGYSIILTADHGNAEEKLDSKGEKIPSHSKNPVPLILLSKNPAWSKARLRPEGGLIDIAPTILQLMDIPVPDEMTGKTLITNN